MNTKIDFLMLFFSKIFLTYKFLIYFFLFFFKKKSYLSQIFAIYKCQRYKFEYTSVYL